MRMIQLKHTLLTTQLLTALPLAAAVLCALRFDAPRAPVEALVKIHFLTGDDTPHALSGLIRENPRATRFVVRCSALHPSYGAEGWVVFNSSDGTLTEDWDQRDGYNAERRIDHKAYSGVTIPIIHRLKKEHKYLLNLPEYGCPEVANQTRKLPLE